MSNQTIEACLRANLQTYFNDLGGETPHDLYNMVQNCFEKPLLEIVMTKAQDNQSRAAQWLGLNRNTLRKKLIEHDLIKDMA